MQHTTNLKSCRLTGDFKSKILQIYLENVQPQSFSDGQILTGPMSGLCGEGLGRYRWAIVRQVTLLLINPALVKRSDWPIFKVKDRAFVKSPSMFCFVYLFWFFKGSPPPKHYSGNVQHVIWPFNKKKKIEDDPSL